MSYGAVNVKLVGGPFDGDAGRLVFPDDSLGTMPESLWVWHCSDPGCPYDNVHWEPDRADARPGSIEYTYDDSGPDEIDVHTYQYGAMGRPLVGVGAEEELYA